MSRHLFDDPHRRRRQAVKRVGLTFVMLSFGVMLLGNYACQSPDVQQPLERIAGEPMVRVKLTAASGKRSAEVSIDGAYVAFAHSITDGERGAELARGAGLRKATVKAAGRGLSIDGRPFAPEWVELVPAVDGAITIGDQRYRGSLLLGRLGSAVMVVNRLRMERYLAGVIGCEMPLSWDLSALTAQAIAARTYALYEISSTSRIYFDVFDSTASQVYRGKSAENDRALEAVSKSRGMVMTWDGEPFKAYFHSTCGGGTADARDIFKTHGITPLSGRPCSYCDQSKVYRWTRSFAHAELARRLSRGLGRRVRRIDAIEPVQLAGGRMIRVRLRHDGTSVVVPGDRLRAAVGTGLKGLLSTSFRARVTPGKVTFEGRGWGHGVGLCQFGAYGLARRGQPATEIVRYYYPGAELVRYW